MKKIVEAKLVGSASDIDIIDKLIHEKIEMQVTFDNGKTYNGHIHNLDFGGESDHLFARVHIPKLDNEDGAEGFMSIMVAIYNDGEVQVFPDDEKKEKPDDWKARWLTIKSIFYHLTHEENKIVAEYWYGPFEGEKKKSSRN